MNLNLYGVFISLGIFSGFWIAERLNKHYQLIHKFSFWDSLLWLVIPGVIGARLYHVVDYWAYYSQYPERILMVWQGGLGIFGAMLGGLVGLVVYFLMAKFSLSLLLKFLDLGVVGLALAQSIGRWGNYFNQELLPVALWESFADFLIFLVLFFFLKKLVFQTTYKPGLVFFLYLILYGLVRFGLEFVRVEPWFMGKILSLLMVVVGLAGIGKKR